MAYPLWRERKFPISTSSPNALEAGRSARAQSACGASLQSKGSEKPVGSVLRVVEIPAEAAAAIAAKAKG